MSGADGDRDTDLTLELLLGAGRSRPGNRMIREVVSDTDSDREYLTLKVVKHSQDLEIHFRVKRTTMMYKLKKSYSERVGINILDLRFLYEGRRIMDDDTPGSLEMESGDYIEVFMGLGLSQHEEREEMRDVTRERRKRAGGSPGPRNTAGDEAGVSRSKKIRLTIKETDTVIYPDDEREDGIEAVRENLAKVTKKYDDLVRKLRDKVECPVCLDVPRSAPVPVCPNGHVVCVKCVRDVCPTCRVRMEQGTSTLAVAVIENIDHCCEYEDCGVWLPHSEIAGHMASCSMRPVNCPGLDCGQRMPRMDLIPHMTGCCVERGEIRSYSLPHRFNYMMNEDVNNLQDEPQNFNWKLEAVKFDNKVFFLKVSRKGRTRRWYFYVQMVGFQAEAEDYWCEVTIVGQDDKYTHKMSGEICPLEVTSVEAADEAGYCMTLRDRAMAKYIQKSKNSQETEFSIKLDIKKK